MKLILGLGNPGSEFEHTRHNAGFDALDRLAAFFQVSLKKRCFFPYLYANVPGGKLIKPLTFMNNSGKALKVLKSKVNANEIVVICDNMDLAVGGVRVRSGGGSCGQKGLNSIARELGSEDFVRIYVGTGRPSANETVVDYVLGKETDSVKLEYYNQALELAACAANDYLNGVSLEQIQCKYNRKGLS